MINSLYAKYATECKGQYVIESEHGFVSYSYGDNEVFIADMYVEPQFRKTGLAKRMLDAVEAKAKQHNCKYITCTVLPSSTNPTLSLKAVLALGFQLLKNDSQMIWFVKELN